MEQYLSAFHLLNPFVITENVCYVPAEPTQSVNPSFLPLMFLFLHSPAWLALSHLQVPVQGEVPQLQLGHSLLLESGFRRLRQLRHRG